MTARATVARSTGRPGRRPGRRRRWRGGPSHRTGLKGMGRWNGEEHEDLPSQWIYI